MEEVAVYDAMERNYGRVSPEMGMREALSILHSTRTNGVVVKRDGELEGYLSLEDDKYGMDLYGISVSDITSRDPLTISKDENINVSLNLLTKSTSGKLIVVEEDLPGNSRVWGRCRSIQQGDQTDQVQAHGGIVANMQ